MRTTRRVLTPASCPIMRLEDRLLLTTFAVVNLADHGAGSFRQAMLDANLNVGADVIEFSVTGTISLNSSLPAMTGEVEIDGTTSPGFAGTPVIEIDFNNTRGLQLAAGSDGSVIQSLALIDASTSGITVNGAGNILIAGNFIGVKLNGLTVAGNRGSGIEITNSSGNTIGGDTAQERNVISGNRKDGVRLSSSSDTAIGGNYIGTDSTGLLDRGNLGNGVTVTSNSTGMSIGGSSGNVISGNDANGVLIDGGSTLNSVRGNVIGLTFNGNAALGNRLDGVKLKNADQNLIGEADAVTGVTYYDADGVSVPVSAWQGIRGADAAGEYLIVGTSGNDGLLFEGTIDGVGTSYAVNYPGSFTTSVYGPDNLEGSNLRLVGSYKNADFATAEVVVNGFLFEGTTGDLANAGSYRTVNHAGSKYNYVHSTMGGLAVGNYDSAADHGSNGLPLGAGHAYIYDVAQDTFLTDVVYPGSLSNTAYGIWYNGEGRYTIVGGYSLDPVNNFTDPNQPIGKAYIVDYDATTGEFSNWTTFEYPEGTNYVTHFEGISSVEKGVYTLNADSVQSGTDNPAQGSFVTVRRNTDGSFGPAAWVDLNVPGYDSSTHISSSNAVYGNQVVGLVIGLGTTASYQATINSEFQLSNVISGNGGNGINLEASDNNHIAMNYIGTDVTGTLDRGNAKNGILVTTGSTGNLIGGEATGGNNPTAGEFARPPQGNLISGNNANGVLITGKATYNQLSGNFIGTDALGTSALGNVLDGVAIVKANFNSLIGCTFPQDPFVFYNVISGNGGNGLRVSSSNDTTIQANFFGVGSDNDTAVGNALDGVLIEGSSARTLMGGPIPLGNVVAANGKNGLEVRGTASAFTTYNTFCGLAAFSLNPNLGNALDGMLITSSGSNILIRTNVITSNGDDGIEISGKARGVRVTGNIIGLNTDGLLPMGNADNGIEVGGNARDIVIGGPQPTYNIIPRNLISANGNNGVAIIGRAKHIEVSSADIGLDVSGSRAWGNAHAGVYIGSGTSFITIGSQDPELLTVISGNGGSGIVMQGTRNNTVIGTLIGTDNTGLLDLGNGGNGIVITDSSNNLIGRVSSGPDDITAGPVNVIAFNGERGILVASGNQNGIRENSIHSNESPGIGVATGANQNQAAPVLATVETLESRIVVSGSLFSTPKTTFTIEFFASDESGPSGQVYLGSQTVTTNKAGIVSFTFQGPLPPDGTVAITATATSRKNNTSEFSAAVAT